MNSTKESVLVDTNILVYLVDNKDALKHASAKRILGFVRLNPGQFVLSTQNIREFANVLVNEPSVSMNIIQDRIAEFRVLFGIIADSPEDAGEAAHLSRAEKVPFWDALLASTANRHGVHTIYTENTKDFARIPSVKAINPLIAYSKHPAE